MLRPLLLASLHALPTFAWADPEVPGPVREAIARMAPAATIEAAQPSALPGVLELVVSGTVLYISTDGRHLLQGTLLDTASGTDLTEQTRAGLRKAGIADLPDATLLRFAPEQPTHAVTVFTAIDCGYCRRFHQDIEAYREAGIAVEYVLLPLAGPGTPADLAARRVHCAADREAAFTRATAGETLQGGETCESGYAAGVDLAARLGIRSTPTIIDGQGRQIGGYLTPEQLLARLDGAD